MLELKIFPSGRGSLFVPLLANVTETHATLGSHALRMLSAQSVSAAMNTMSTAERNLVTASLPAAARRALLKAR
jgi:hypothetical protein